MPARRLPLPETLLDGPFTAAEAEAAGLGAKVLRGRSVRRLHQSVYVAADHELTVALRVQAARGCCPPEPRPLE